jgi:hypothetical protein
MIMKISSTNDNMSIKNSLYFIIFIIMIMTLSIAIYLTIFASEKHQYEYGVLESKYFSCNNIHGNSCKAYFNIFIENNDEYCIVKKDNITYNSYIVNNTYKISDIETIGNITSCNFGESISTNNTIYQVGIGLFVIFALIFCCMYAYMKTKMFVEKNIGLDYVNTRSSLYPTAIAERCNSSTSTILVTVTQDNLSDGDYVNIQDDQLIVSHV